MRMHPPSPQPVPTPMLRQPLEQRRGWQGGRELGFDVGPALRSHLARRARILQQARDRSGQLLTIASIDNEARLAVDHRFWSAARTPGHARDAAGGGLEQYHP